MNGRSTATDLPEGELAVQRTRMTEGLAAAIREKGLANAQISDIVRHARASRTTFYRCFDDKDACFVALAEELMDEARRKVLEAVDFHAPAPVQVDQSVDAFLEAVAGDSAMSVTISSDLPRLSARAAELRMQTIELYAEMVFALVHSPGVEAQMGPLRHITIEKCAMLIFGIEGLVDRAAKRGDDVRELAPDIKGVIKRVLAPEGWSPDA